MITFDSLIAVVKDNTESGCFSYEKSFLYFQMDNGLFWWNTCPQEYDLVLELFNKQVLIPEGIFIRYGTKHLRYRFKNIKYPPYFKRAISRKQKAEILNRDGFKCVYCGSPDNIEVDHMHPYSKEGHTHESNLQLLCKSCNVKKSNKTT